MRHRLRFHAAEPDVHFLRHVAAVHHPCPTPVLDMVDFVPRYRIVFEAR